MKVSLKYNNSNDKERIIAFANMMAKSFLIIPYASQVDTFASNMMIIHTDKSPVDFVCQALYTCGTKVIADKKAPNKPSPSIHVIRSFFHLIDDSFGNACE